ncbi:MAG: S41 family peptidase [Chloroflexota bacterium]
MNRRSGSSASRPGLFSRSGLVGLVMAALLIVAASAPSLAAAQARRPLDRQPTWIPASVVDRPAASVPLVADSPSDLLAVNADPVSARSVANQSDPGPGLELISAVFNSLMDRFFRPLDSRDLLEAAWEGARRALASARALPNDIAAPELTGDRAGDLAAFSTQWRALVAAVGPNINANRLAMAASAVMTQSLDEQHTYFLPPEDFARYVAQLTSDGDRVGLGVAIQGSVGPFTIGAVIPASPAEKAGLQEGDSIEAVDDHDMKGRQSAELLEMLRGQEGQPVKLRIRRGGENGQTLDITVVRGRYKDAPLTMRVLPEGVCLLRLTSFPVSFVVGPTGRTIGEELEYDLEQCEKAGVKGWIVDLRGNPGGNAIGETLGKFMDAGPIMVEKDRLGGRYEQATDGHLFRVQHPLAVLIDGNSASASEVFASAVQEHKRAVVLGQKSAGALNTTTIVRLPLDAGMGVAIRQVTTGIKETVVDEVGVTPDVELQPSRDPFAVPPEAIAAVLSPPAGIGPLQPGPNPFEGVLSAAELKQRATPVLLKAEDAAQPADRVNRGEMAFDTLLYYESDYPSLKAARERALRLGWQGIYARWIGADFPPKFTATVSFYKDGDGAHKDLREIYEPGEPQNPKAWKDVDSPVMLGDETLAQVGTGQNDGRIWIAWRRGGTVYTVAQSFMPGEAQPFDEVARLAKIMDERAQAAGS